MQKSQDDFFDRNFWIPALNIWKKMNFTTPLSLAIIYDSCIHGSFLKINKMTKFNNEVEWSSQYLSNRQAWIKKQPNLTLQKTAYRQDEFKMIIKDNNFNLDQPLIVRKIDLYKQKKLESRILKFSNPNLKGKDILDLQFLLKQNKISIQETSIFDKETEIAVKQFQKLHGLKEDGIVGPTTLQELEKINLVTCIRNSSNTKIFKFVDPVMSGDTVIKIQELLIKNKVLDNSNGLFDKETEIAVKKFQKLHGLKEDGIVGPTTLQELEN
jgi:murein L,D-transpeptidase YcbB/YkuD